MFSRSFFCLYLRMIIMMVYPWFWAAKLLTLCCWPTFIYYFSNFIKYCNIGFNGTAYCISECFGLTSFTFLQRIRNTFYPSQSTVSVLERPTREIRLKFVPKEKINWIKPNLPLTTLRGFGSGKSIKLNSPPLCRNNIKCNDSVSSIFIKPSPPYLFTLNVILIPGLQRNPFFLLTTFCASNKADLLLLKINYLFLAPLKFLHKETF